MQKREEIQQQANEQVKDLVKQIDKFPVKWENYNDLGVLLTQMGDYNSAEELIMKALGLFQENKQAKEMLTYTLANVYYFAQEYDKAVNFYQKITNQSLKTDAFVMLAQSFVKQNKYQQAMAYALTAYENSKEDKTIINILADVCLALGDFDNAYNYYQKSMLIDKNQANVLFGLGLISLVFEKRNEADQYFKSVLKLDENYYNQNKQKIDDILTILQNKK